jgi:UDP-N-acetylglucosamine:LPS N-acetylglucosamine transferase
MLALEPAWRSFDVTWVTLEAPDTNYLLRDESKVLAHGPTNRSLRNLARNLLVARRTIRKVEPDGILSTGAALAVPFFIVGRLHRRRTVYVESLTRIQGPSFSGRLVYPFATAFFVQWQTTRSRRRMRYEGSIL